MAEMNEGNIKLDLNEFSLQIFLIGGGKGDGEGILILFLSKDEVFRTISIDCCKAVISGTESNLLEKVLKSFKVDKIDCFVWTHPHEDHTKGLDTLIDSFYRKSSIGVLPKQIYGNDNDIVKMKDYPMTVLKKFNSKFKKKNLKSIDCQCKEMCSVYAFNIEDTLTGHIASVQLYCLTPMAFLLDDKRRTGKKISDTYLNDISLSLILDIDGYSFFFGGDASDKTLKECNTDSLYKCRWIKVPHHASKTSSNVISYFNNSVDSAAVISFLSQQLPNSEVLRKYQGITQQIYVTQKEKTDVSGFGMIRYCYTFKDSAVQLKVTRYGNAYKYDEK